MSEHRFHSCLIALPLTWALLTTPLSAALVQTGNVLPAINTWTSGTDGYIGSTSDGSVLVDAGSRLESETAYLGRYSGSTGTATVTGAGSKWINSYELYVGKFGSGILAIEAGGQVSYNRYAYLGYESSSTGTAMVTGAGSTWTNIEWLYVGESGNGTLTVEAGGQVSTRYGILGSNSGSTGTATVTGAGSKWTNSHELYVGYFGSGTLTVADGGEVVAASLGASLGDLLGNGTIRALSSMSTSCSMPRMAPSRVSPSDLEAF